jgi:hypothetical protein
MPISDIHFYSNMIYRNLEGNLRSLNIFMKSAGIKDAKDTYVAGINGDDLPYDLAARPYYVDSFIFNLDRSSWSDFDSE